MGNHSDFDHFLSSPWIDLRLKSLRVPLDGLLTMAARYLLEKQGKNISGNEMFGHYSEIVTFSFNILNNYLLVGTHDHLNRLHYSFQISC